MTNVLTTRKVIPSSIAFCISVVYFQMYLRDAKQAEVLLNQQENFLSKEEVPVSLNIDIVCSCMMWYLYCPVIHQLPISLGINCFVGISYADI